MQTCMWGWRSAGNNIVQRHEQLPSTTLSITGTVAFVTYEKFDLNLLRRAWVNLDLVWPVALIVDGWRALLVPAS